MYIKDDGKLNAMNYLESNVRISSSPDLPHMPWSTVFEICDNMIWESLLEARRQPARPGYFVLSERQRLLLSVEEVCLAGARTADEHHVVPGLDERAAVQRAHQCLVHTGLAELEAGQVTVGRPSSTRSAISR